MNNMNSDLATVDVFLVSFIVEKHHIYKDKEDAGVTLHSHPPLKEDKEDKVTE